MDTAATASITTTTHTHTHTRPRTRSRPDTRKSATSTTPASLPSAISSWYHQQPDSASAQQPHAPQHSNFANDLSQPQSLHERVTVASNIRPRSPDILSRVSASSSSAPGGPQLRKKPKSLTIKNKPRLDSAHAVTTPTASSGQNWNEQPAAASAANSAIVGQPWTQANSTKSQPHSPVYRRPPASHSSYGVETTCGPPPSFTTQRTFSQERIKKVDRNTIIWIPNQDKAAAVAVDSQEDDSPISTGDRREEFTSWTQNSPDTADDPSVPTPPDMDPMANVTIRGNQAVNGHAAEEDMKGSSSDERKSEDLFLNIAKVDGARTSMAKADRKRSRISIPFLSSGRSTQEIRSSPIHAQQKHESEQLTPQLEEPRYYSKRSSIGPHMPGVLSRNNLNEANRVRERSTEPTSEADGIERQFGRRNSNANTEHTRLTQRPSQGLRSQRFAPEAGYNNPSRLGEHIATESTVSTTAPSTVWDELDDLKSRIRKLELTGKLPPSSAAAMSTAERPRTATTAATTMSASPKFKTAATSLPSAIDGIPSSVHPLLHEALGNAKQVLSQEVYNKLYATASDALQLATMMSSISPDLNHPVSPNYERQMRRRTESMCRGLTELTIALTSESKATTSALNRPGSRDQSHPPSAMLRSRRYSNDPGERSAPSRVTSRLDTRRTSLIMSPISPEPSTVESSLPPLPGLRLGRASTVTRSRRGPTNFDGGEDEQDASPSIRPVSRAMTELAAYRRPSREPVHISRELLTQHPMPKLEPSGHVSTPLSATANNNFVSRRKNAHPSAVAGAGYESSPITPRENLTPRDGWGKGPLVPNEQFLTPTDVVSEMGRTGSGRRNLGFASRIGSSVGSRLRAARSDRHGRESFGDGRMAQDMTPS